MDITDILGGLLKRKVEQGGKGGDALNDMFKRHTNRAEPSSKPLSPDDIDRYAEKLEEVLNIDDDPRVGSPTPSPKRHQEKSQPADQRSLVLVRAMVNAAKSDGRIDQAEQASIMEHLKNRSPETIQFLREEFARPLDVQEFARSVPVGMEEQVYTLSLIAIDLDTGQEAKYLMDLSDRLRLPSDTRERIHQRLGAPSIY